MAAKKTTDSIEIGRPAPWDFVTLPDGRTVPAIKTELEPNAHSASHLLAWINKVEATGNFPRYRLEFKRKLCNDPRMSDFWEWLGTVQFSRHDMMRSSTSVSETIHRSTRLPGKPGNMTPMQREAYFKKVRSHAEALMELLEGTKFDNPYMSELTEKMLDAPLRKALHSWGADEMDEGHVVAFQVTPDGAYSHHYDFPENILTQTLYDVLGWTYWDDGWDGRIFSTSAPIAQANSESTPIIYFCCTLHDWFRGYGVEVPFGILASVANVALDLPADKQIDEDSARKQVRRYQQRRAKMQEHASFTPF